MVVGGWRRVAGRHRAAVAWIAAVPDVVPLDELARTAEGVSAG